MPEIIPNLHPFFVHFPIALTITCFLFLLLGHAFNITKYPALASGFQRSALYILWASSFFFIVTVIAGFYAYYTVSQHNEIIHAAMQFHRNIALVTTLSIIVLSVWSIYLFYKDQFPTKIFTICFTIPVILVLCTGYFGGELVYRYSVGVLSSSPVDISQQHGDHMHNH